MLVAKHKNREGLFDRTFNTINFTLVTLFMIIVIYPLIYILSCSISDPTLVGSGQVWLLPKGLNINGYIRVFQDKNIVTGYLNSIFYTFFGTSLNLTLTLLSGYALSKKDLPGKKLILVYMFITMYFSGGLIPSYLVVKSLGLLNTRLVLILNGAVSIYYVIICRTFFRSIPAELEEASHIDGGGVFKTFWLIALPLSRALIGVMSLYYGVAHWNSYFGAMIYIIDNSKKPLQLFLRTILVTEQMSAAMSGGNAEMQFQMEQLKQLLKYSVIVVSSLPVLIAYPFFQKYFEKGVMLGSLKG